MPTWKHDDQIENTLTWKHRFLFENMKTIYLKNKFGNMNLFPNLFALLSVNDKTFKLRMMFSK